LDGSKASPTAQNGASSHALAPIATLQGGGAVVAEVARAVEHDLTTPGPRASHGARLHSRLVLSDTNNRIYAIINHESHRYDDYHDGR